MARLTTSSASDPRPPPAPSWRSLRASGWWWLRSRSRRRWMRRWRPTRSGWRRSG